MRGKLIVSVAFCFTCRIIPAHAGQTQLRTPRYAPLSDHPRACGANARGRAWRHVRQGSSPRMRGKLGAGNTVPAHLRIIPAHAGQTPAVPRVNRTWPDHPRACGANYHAELCFDLRCGSSPRMRGKRTAESTFFNRRRIIPAHAGQTRCDTAGSRTAPDHPRACGANFFASSSARSAFGSSPRMRGKLAGVEGLAVRGRIIPAHAGQTRCFPPCRRCWTDHPRACGANTCSASEPGIMAGSSPRMRGKPPAGREPFPP